MEKVKTLIIGSGPRDIQLPFMQVELVSILYCILVCSQAASLPSPQR